MHDVITDRHCTQAPATFIDGDGILAIDAIKIVRGGYTSFAEGV